MNNARGRTSSFPLISCGEEERFRFPPRTHLLVPVAPWAVTLLGPPFCTPNPWSPVKHRPETSCSGGCCYATDCFPDVVGTYPEKNLFDVIGCPGFPGARFSPPRLPGAGRHVETVVVRARTLLHLVGVMPMGRRRAIVSGGVVPKTRILSRNFLT
jgi:hypothetical protein